MNNRHWTIEQKILALADKPLNFFNDRSHTIQTNNGHIIFYLKHVTPALNPRQYRAMYNHTITQDDLRQLMIEARASGFEPTRLSHLLAANKTETQERLFSVVISGAYWDTLDYALPTLEAAGIPCTILTSLAELEWRSAPWCALALDVINNNEKIAYDDDGHFQHFFFTSRAEREAAFNYLEQRWRQGNKNVRIGILEMCKLYTGNYMRATARKTCLPPSELMALAENPLTQFGLNTTDNFLKSGLSLKGATAQLTHEKSIIESYVNQPLVCVDLSALLYKDDELINEGITAIEHSNLNLTSVAATDNINFYKKLHGINYIPMLSMGSNKRQWQPLKQPKPQKDISDQTPNLADHHRQHTDKKHQGIVSNATSLIKAYQHKFNLNITKLKSTITRTSHKKQTEALSRKPYNSTS